MSVQVNRIDERPVALSRLSTAVFYILTHTPSLKMRSCHVVGAGCSVIVRIDPGYFAEFGIHVIPCT